MISARGDKQREESDSDSDFDRKWMLNIDWYLFEYVEYKDNKKRDKKEGQKDKKSNNFILRRNQ